MTGLYSLPVEIETHRRASPKSFKDVGMVFHDCNGKKFSEQSEFVVV